MWNATNTVKGESSSSSYFDSRILQQNHAFNTENNVQLVFGFVVVFVVLLAL